MNGELFTEHIDISQGLYGSSDAASTPSGFCMEAENCDFSKEGVVRKRRGYSVLGGKFPLRCRRIEDVDGVNSKLLLDSQPEIRITGKVYPFGTETTPDLVNQLIDGYHLASSVLSQVAVLKVDEEIKDINFMDKPIFIYSTGNYFLANYRLSEDLYVIPKWAAVEIQGTDVFSESGFEVDSYTLLAYRGLFFSYFSSEEFYEVEIDGTKCTLRNDSAFSGEVFVGDKVLIDTGISVRDYPIKGSIAEVNSLSTVVTLEEDLGELGQLDINYFRMFHIPKGNTVLYRDEAFENGEVLSIESAVCLNTSYTTAFDYDKLMFIYGIPSHKNYPCSGVGVLEGVTLAIHQNTPFTLSSFTEYQLARGRLTDYSENTIVGVIRGEATLSINNSDGLFSKGDTAFWYSVTTTGEEVDTEEYEIVDVSDSTITLGVEGKTRLFVSHAARIYAKRTSTEVELEGENRNIVAGNTVFLPDQEHIIKRVFLRNGRTVLVLENETEFSFSETLNVRGGWQPVPIESEVAYPNVVHYGLFTDDYTLAKFVKFGDRLYLTAGENIFRFNGKRLVSMNFGAPPTPLMRRAYGTYGSLPTRSDTDGSYAEEMRFSVTYYWEDTDGKGMESTYVSSEDLRFRPGVNVNGDSTWVELQVPTFPRGLGIPADEVTIRVYGVSTEADSNIMTLITEVDNNPDKATESIIVGDKFTTFLGNYSKDQAFIDVARDSPKAAPKAKHIEVSNGCLVAGNAVSSPRLEVICDKLFKDQNNLLQDNYRMTYQSISGGSIDFVGVPCTYEDGSITPTDTGARGFEGIEFRQVSPVPPRSVILTHIIYRDFSNLFSMRTIADSAVLSDIYSTRYFSGTPGYDRVNPRRKTVLYPLKEIDWSIDFGRELFYTYETPFEPYTLHSQLKQTEEEFLDEAVGPFHCLGFAEAIVSNGNLYDLDLVIFVLGGSVYLGWTSPYSSAVSSINGKKLKVRFWDDVDESLGNLKDTNGKVYSWHEDLVFRFESAIVDSIDINGQTVNFSRMVPLRLSLDGDYSLVEKDISFSGYVDVTHQAGGNSHGSFSLMLESDIGVFEVERTWELISRRAFAVFSNTPGDPSGISDIGNTVRFKAFNNDGTYYEQKENVIDFSQVFKVVDGEDSGSIVRRTLEAAKAPRTPISSPPDTYEDVVIDNFDNMLLVPEEELEIDVNGNFTLKTVNAIPATASSGDWCYVQVSGKSVDQVFFSCSGWYKIEEVISTTEVKFKNTQMDNPSIGENTFTGSFILFGDSKTVPIPMPRQDILKGDEFDPAHQLFFKEKDEGTNPLNSMVSRFALAINTVLRDVVTARWGSTPTGDFASDYLPANGFQIEPHHLVDRYGFLGKTIHFLDRDDYDNPVDRWMFGGDYSTIYSQTPFSVYGYILKEGVSIDGGGLPIFLLDVIKEKTTKVEMGGNKLVLATYTDFQDKSSYWWTSPFYGANNEIRLPIFTFLGTDSLGSSSEDGISGMASWRDSLIIAKEESLWKVIVGDDAQQRRVESPVGSISELVATSKGVYFLTKFGVYATDGNESLPIRNTDRQFNERVVNNSGLRLGRSYNNRIDKTLFIGVPYDKEGEHTVPNARFRFCYETGAWSVDTGINATCYASNENTEVYASYDGLVYYEKRRGETVYNDNGNPIPFKLRTRYTSTNIPDLKFWRQFILYLGSDDRYNLKVGYAKDFEIHEGDYQELPIKPSLYGSSYGKGTYGGSAWLAPYRVSSISRSSHLSLSFEDSELNSPVEIFSIWLEGQKLNTRKKKEKQHYG